MTRKVTFDHVIRQVTEQTLIMVAAREKAERILEREKRLFIGKKYEPFKSGNLAGLYEITDVDINAYDGAIIGHGRKITHSGLGNQRWDLGRLHLSRFRT